MIVEWQTIQDSKGYLGSGLVTRPVRLFCDPLDCCPPGSSVHGILQARILEWVAMPFSSPQVYICKN